MLKPIAAALFGVLLLAVGGYLYFVRSGPEPQLWHTTRLHEEFTAADEARVADFAGYLALEDRLFAELDRRVRTQLPPEQRLRINRFNPGSLSDPEAFPGRWNRSHELAVQRPRAAALLLHGLSDSPYSMRALAERLQSAGVYVLVLRMPGHGTATSGLRSVEVEDMRAAVRIGMRELRARFGEAMPLFMVGYSNGAALAVDYSLSVLEGAALPRPAGLVLLSPAIGLPRIAVLARIRTGLSSVPGFGRAAWQDIATEVDPFKYSSFPFRAAGETQRLTASIADRVEALSKSGPLRGFPPTLAFISTVDATVRAAAVVDDFLEHLAPGGHELVLFDINRLADAQALLRADPGPLTAQLLAMQARPFTLSVLTNSAPDSLDVHVLSSAAGSTSQRTQALGLAWPRHVFSLSHVALPFTPDDPLYGYTAADTPGRIQLGNVEVRGENGVLRVPSWMLMRLRSNPFFPYLAQRVEDFVLQAAPAS